MTERHIANNSQRLQNRLALVLTKSPKFNHSVPLLWSLHWLAEKFRLDFKICMLTYTRFVKTACLSSLHACHITPIPVTKIKQRNHTVCPKSQEQDRCESVSIYVPSLWNNLPLSVHSATSAVIFRKRLKSHLFDLAPTIDIYWFCTKKSKW